MNFKVEKIMDCSGRIVFNLFKKATYDGKESYSWLSQSNSLEEATDKAKLYAVTYKEAHFTVYNGVASSPLYL